MTIKVIPDKDENISRALSRLNKLVDSAHSQPWTKRRYGYYEKPSVIRRRRKKMRWRQNLAKENSKRLGVKGTGLKLHIGLKAKLRRNGPNNSLGR